MRKRGDDEEPEPGMGGIGSAPYFPVSQMRDVRGHDKVFVNVGREAAICPLFSAKAAYGTILLERRFASRTNAHTCEGPRL